MKTLARKGHIHRRTYVHCMHTCKTKAGNTISYLHSHVPHALRDWNLKSIFKEFHLSTESFLELGRIKTGVLAVPSNMVWACST